MREKKWFPIGYMFVVSAFFSSIIIAFARVTQVRVEANEKLAFERAVVTALPELGGAELTNAQVHQRFIEQVSEPDPSSGGAYALKQGGQVVAYAVPMSGQGFWAPIAGVIGVAADKQTVTGIAFYQQNETPGLGAEITKPAFRNQFKGKQLASGDKPIDMKRPGAELGASDVHAVTGATQTSTRLERIINEALRSWRSKMGQEGQPS
ncbi:MAG: FMN-binding protein [Sedimentisphaerales bacterium]|nr:FMN-binding protein [Sedimentisphaerales bacterium]